MRILVIALVAAFALPLLGFWIWMLVDCLTKESREGQDRLLWTLVIIFTKFLGAALYYFLRYRRPEICARTLETLV